MIMWSYEAESNEFKQNSVPQTVFIQNSETEANERRSFSSLNDYRFTSIWSPLTFLPARQWCYLQQIIYSRINNTMADFFFLKNARPLIA